MTPNTVRTRKFTHSICRQHLAQVFKVTLVLTAAPANPDPIIIPLNSPPGCCKTTLVRAAATASGAHVVALTGAALFSMYVGEGEALLRSAFQRARQAAPAIVFLDELDSLVGALLSLLHKPAPCCRHAASLPGSAIDCSPVTVSLDELVAVALRFARMVLSAQCYILAKFTIRRRPTVGYSNPMQADTQASKRKTA